MYFGNSNPEIYIFSYFTLKLKYSKIPFICLFSHLVSFSTICPRHGQLDCLQNELMNLLCQRGFMNNIHDIFKSILLCSPIMALLWLGTIPGGKQREAGESTYNWLQKSKLIRGSVSKLCFLLFVILNAEYKCMFLKCFGLCSKMWIILPEGKSTFLQPLHPSLI